MFSCEEHDDCIVVYNRRCSYCELVKEYELAIKELDDTRNELSKIEDKQ